VTTQTGDQQLTLPSASDNTNLTTMFTSLVVGTAAVESRLVKRYLNAADRALRNPTPATGELSFRVDTKTYESYTGSTWVPIGPFGNSTAATSTGSGSVSTTSTAYTDTPSGGGLQVGFIAPTTGRVVVSVSAVLSANASANVYMSFRLTGPTTRAASDLDSIHVFSNNQFLFGARPVLCSGLTPNGVYTCITQYRVDANTGAYQERSVIVEPAA
jgi:hypothetical protein